LRTPPEKFKAETLDDIKYVFNFSGVEENNSLYENPLYAGFGNQTTV
jgi:phosphatidate phosphatase PAH1